MPGLTFAILICHVPERKETLARLLAGLEPQIVPGVQIFIRSDDHGTMSTGAKRNVLLDSAQDARYSAFVDDDDVVAPKYVSSILMAIQGNPDAVGFKTRRYVDGKLAGEAIHSIRYLKSETLQFGNWTRYHRVPNHLNPVRMELAQATRFKDITFGEDHDYANRLRPLLKTEAFIDEYLYDYLLIRTPNPWAPPCTTLNLTPPASMPSATG